jgi:hypothetical protein
MATFVKAIALNEAEGGKEEIISINTDMIACFTGGPYTYKVTLKDGANIPGYRNDNITVSISQGDQGKLAALGLL